MTPALGCTLTFSTVPSSRPYCEPEYRELVKSLLKSSTGYEERIMSTGPIL
jgi:hypothetical protein